MFVLKQIGPKEFSAAAPFEGFEATGATLQEAVDKLTTSMRIMGFARSRIKFIRANTTISFQPEHRAYAADFAPYNLRVLGATRRHAFDNLVEALVMIDKARQDAAAAEAAAQSAPETIEAPGANAAPSVGLLENTSTGDDGLPRDTPQK